MPPRHKRHPEQEQQWLDGLRVGDIQAFESIYRTYFTSLWHFAARTIPPDAAEDVVQDVLFGIWQRRSQLGIDGHLAPYLFAAVRSKVIQYLRHQRVADRFEQSADAHTTVVGDSPSLPDAHVTTEELRVLIERALAGLSEQQRAILMLRWGQGMTYEEIASVLKISHDAAKKGGGRAQKVVLPLLRKVLS